MNTQKTETHPLLPSGEWEGFYCYHYSPQQHKMSTELMFSHAIVSGSGVDDVAPFTWMGKYSLDTFKIDMYKSYTTHEVFYKGDIDENGIWGNWEIFFDVNAYPKEMVAYAQQYYQQARQEMIGGFHIWPKKLGRGRNARSQSEKKESNILKEIYQEIFS